VEHEYWQEKRLNRKHVLTAWFLVVVLLVVGLGMSELSGGTSPDLVASLRVEGPALQWPGERGPVQRFSARDPLRSFPHH
jgi:hypothetical protein